MLFKDAADAFSKLEGISSRLEMIDALTELLKKTDKGEVRQLIYFTQGILAAPFEGIEIGVAEKMTEEAISIATGYTKDQVVASFRKTGDLGLTAEELTAKTKLRRMTHNKYSMGEVFETMLKIATKSGVGSQEGKIKHLSELLAASSPIEARYITRFALGQLRLGVGDATILEGLSKAFTGSRDAKEQLEDAYNICSDLGRVGEVLLKDGMKGVEHLKVTLFSPVRPALAERLPTAKEILEKMGGTCAVESKYDGLRVQIHMDKKAKKVEIFSRRLEKLTPMFPELVKAALEEVDAKTAIFEGEAILYDEVSEQFRPFQETIQRKRKHGVEEMSAEMPLHVFTFDLLYLDGEDYLGVPYKDRRKKLEDIIGGKGTLRLSGRIITSNPKEFEKYFETEISDGLEGVIAKDLSAKYIAGARKFSWIKMKRSYKGELSDTVDLVIIGFYRGKGMRTEFGFGGLLAAVYNDKKDMFESVTRIGTGFSEELMKSLRDTLSKIKKDKKPARVISTMVPDFWVEPKYIVTVRADEITKSSLHMAGLEKQEDGTESGLALRFPRIVGGGIREDKSAEDATTTKELIEMFKQQRKTKLAEN